MTRRFLVATSNPGKLREVEAALAPVGVEVVGLDALSNRDPVEETGATFEDNARLKAEAYSRRTDLTVLADDSGLEVDALDGAPGVRSARYGGPGLSDAERCGVLLEAIRDVPDARRTARFRCVIAVARAGETIAVFHGKAEGRLLRTPRGESGFGYDPVFFDEDAGRTFAELTREEKQRRSHRGEALRRLLGALERGELEAS